MDKYHETLYIGISKTTIDRAGSHGKKPWGDDIAYWTRRSLGVVTRQEAEAIEQDCIEREHPKYNVVHNRAGQLREFALRHPYGCWCGDQHFFTSIDKPMSASGTDKRTYRSFGLAPKWLTIEEAAPALGINNPTLRDKLSESKRGGRPGKWVRFRHTTQKKVIAIWWEDLLDMVRERASDDGT